MSTSSTVDRNYLLLQFLLENGPRLERLLGEDSPELRDLLVDSVSALAHRPDLDLGARFERIAAGEDRPAARLLGALAAAVRNPSPAGDRLTVQVPLGRLGETPVLLETRLDPGPSDLGQVHRLALELLERLGPGRGRPVRGARSRSADREATSGPSRLERFDFGGEPKGPRPQRLRDPEPPGSLGVPDRRASWRGRFRDQIWESYASESEGASTRPGPPPAAPEAGVEAIPEERRINVWVAERARKRRRPLVLGETYRLLFQFAPPVEGSLVEGPATMIPDADIPEAGLDTEWVVSSPGVEMSARGPEVTVKTVGEPPCWTARFALRIPKSGSSEVREVAVTPRAAEPRLHVAVYVGRELYRELTVELAVEGPPSARGAARVRDEQVHAAAGHLGLGTTHEWTTPWGWISLSVPRTAPAVVVRASFDSQEVDEDMPPPWKVTTVAGRMLNVRASAERFRARWEKYLDDVDPDDLAGRLLAFSPEYDWRDLSNQADAAHQQAWDRAAASPELRDLAADGYDLYQALFPPRSELRGWIDALPPSGLLEVSWKDGELSNIPWGLMYKQAPPPPGEPVDATLFFGLRHRIAYTTHRPANRSKALGNPARVHQANLLYWGEHPEDATGAEARRQRQRWAGFANQVFVGDGVDRKTQLLSLLDRPAPSPVAVLYLFCQCKVGQGNDPVLSFGDSAADVLRRTDLSASDLADHPLVFANACTTASADPYLASELEAGFFERGCRGFLGTETKVPIALASRFATLFLDFFHRRVDPEPMAAGEALTQARLFLWTRYRNIGGLFYTYVNQYELFLADDAELAAMRA